MTIKESITFLKENGYIIESEKFNNFDTERLGKHIEKRRKTNISHSSDVKYNDDMRYYDYEGIKWLDVKKHDDVTLLSAIVDGLIDTSKNENEEIDNNEYEKMLSDAYSNVKNKNDLLAIIEDYFDVDDLVDKILNFLKKYMHGTTTVYRGYNFTKEEYEKLVSENNIRKRSDLLKILNNKSKQFNSFSVYLKIARGFANYKTSNNFKNIIIAAEVEPNDINFAFTAYLMARHHTIGEYELNINNLKDLKNLRIIDDVEREEKINVRIPSIEMLNKEISKNGIEDTFEYVKELDNGCYDCLIKTKHVLVKDKKIISPFSNETIVCFSNNPDIAALNTTNEEYLYRLYSISNQDYLNKKIYDGAIISPYEGFLIAYRKKTELYEIIDVKTGKTVLGKGFTSVLYAPEKFKNISNKNTFLINDNGQYTIIDIRNGKSIFMGINNSFKSIYYDAKNNLIIATTLDNKKVSYSYNKEIGKLVKYV